MIERNFHITKLIAELAVRKSKNSLYSVRSYARDLELDSSSLSSILIGNRKIPQLKIEQIAGLVCSSEAEKKKFIASAKHVHTSLNKIKKQKNLPDRIVISEDKFIKISEVETYTFLSMLELENCPQDVEWLAKKLNKTKKWVQNTISILTEYGMVEEVNGRLVRTTRRTTTNDEVTSKYIIKHHIDSLVLAGQKCAELLPDERYFSTITIPSDPEHLNYLKTLFMEFEDKISEYLSTKKKTDVYKLSIQFYPATEKI